MPKRLATMQGNPFLDHKRRQTVSMATKRQQNRLYGPWRKVASHSGRIQDLIPVARAVSLMASSFSRRERLWTVKAPNSAFLMLSFLQLSRLEVLWALVSRLRKAFDLCRAEIDSPSDSYCAFVIWSNETFWQVFSLLWIHWIQKALTKVARTEGRKVAHFGLSLQRSWFCILSLTLRTEWR